MHYFNSGETKDIKQENPPAIVNCKRKKNHRDSRTEKIISIGLSCTNGISESHLVSLAS